MAKWATAPRRQALELLPNRLDDPHGAYHLPRPRMALPMKIRLSCPRCASLGFPSSLKVRSGKRPDVRPESPQDALRNTSRIMQSATVRGTIWGMVDHSRQSRTNHLASYGLEPILPLTGRRRLERPRDVHPMGDVSASIWTLTAPSAMSLNKHSQKAGSYYCWNRTYDPSTGRWSTPDPAASSWSNLLLYADSNPAMLDDPTGLQGSNEKTVNSKEYERRSNSFGLLMAWDKKPTALGPCGGAIMAVEWFLDVYINDDGWVVQQVTSHFDVSTCLNVRTKETNQVWEAWRVVGGNVYKGSAEFVGQRLFYEGRGTIGATDTFWFPNLPSTKGWWNAVGRAYYIRDKNYVADHFKGKQSPSTGTAESTDTKPKGFQAWRGRTHGIEVSWDCCCKPKKPTTVHGWMDSDDVVWYDYYHGDD